MFKLSSLFFYFPNNVIGTMRHEGFDPVCKILLKTDEKVILYSKNWEGYLFAKQQGD